MPEFENQYYDDPVEDSGSPAKTKLSSIIAFLLLLVGGTYLVQTTLAANISLNTGSPLEFGQGISATTACSGATNLTITPNSTFVNSSGAGAHYFSSVTVSNIPSNCQGFDFTINAYNNSSSTPLALFNSTSTSAVVYNNSGTFQRGIGSTGLTVSSGSGTFTISFTNPVALSSSVYKLTIQSGPNNPYYEVGSTGPGGGKIFYVNEAGFNCGEAYASNGSPTGGKCNYLEVAPSGWNTGSDPTKRWSPSDVNIPSVNIGFSPSNAISGVGLGYKNSIAIVSQHGAYNASSNNYAAGAARAYSGGSKSDWYLPTTAELNLLLQWVRGVAPSVTTTWTSYATINNPTYGASSAGFINSNYFSSSERASSVAYGQFSDGTQFSTEKSGTGYVRPIRAF
jgi:hypothetical protein